MQTMKTMKTNLQLTAYAFFGVALATASTHAQTLLDQSFDGVANDTGPAFQQVSNGVGNGSHNANPSTGVILTGTNDNSAQNSTGLKASTAINVTTSAPSATGFTVDWVIDSAQFSSNATNTNDAGTVNANGFGLVVGDNLDTGGSGLWSNQGNVFGFTILSENWSQDEIGIFEAGGGSTVSTSTGVASPSAASINDGFTLSFTFNSDETWSAFTTGLSDNISATGTAGTVSYSALAASLVPNTGVQGRDIQYTLGSVTVTAIPEPGTYALLFGAFALAWVAVRRRQS